MRQLLVLFLFLSVAGCTQPEDEFPSGQVQFEEWLKTITPAQFHAESTGNLNHTEFIPIYRTQLLCEVIDCAKVYTINGKKAPVWTVEDLFQRGMPHFDAGLHIGVSEYGGKFTFNLSKELKPE